MSNIVLSNQVLSQLHSHTPVKGIYLVTGERGSGKTTWLKKLIAEAQAANISISGLLTPGSFVAGEKIAINLVDLSHNQTRVMSTLVEQHQAAGCGGIHRLESGELVLGGWHMHEEVLQWGNELLKTMLTEPNSSQTQHFLIIDELGPLEFVHGLGFTNALVYANHLNSIITTQSSESKPPSDGKQPLTHLGFTAAFIVVRPNLVTRAHLLWPQAQIIEILPVTPK